MSLVTFKLSSGREVSGNVPFFADSVNEPVKSVTIDHPQLKITLTGPYYFIINDRAVAAGGPSLVTTNIGVYDGITAKGYRFTPSLIRPIQIDLAKLHPRSLEKMLKISG